MKIRTPRAKYGNKPTTIDGRRFASQKEAHRYAQLKLLLGAGRIRELELQVPFRLGINGVLIATYKADFCYDERVDGKQWRSVVEDVKGYQTPAYRLKKKLMQAIHGIHIRET